MKIAVENNEMIIELIIIIIHIVVALIYYVRIVSGRSYLRKDQMALIFIVPIFGPLAGLTIDAMATLNKHGVRPIDLDPLELEHEVIWMTLKSFHENADIIPLEEAILINDVEVRRRFMLETLYTDPLKYLDVLNLAKYNDDVETSHYATTTISKAQKDFQLSIQKLGVALENDHDNQSILDRYIETLLNYINSNLLEEHLVRNLRIVYSKALDKKIELSGDDINTYIMKARNCINLAEFNLAFEVSDLLISTWPANENSWIESIRICVESKDGSRLGEIVSKMKTHKIDWTRAGRESLKVWLTETSNEA